MSAGLLLSATAVFGSCLLTRLRDTTNLWFRFEWFGWPNRLLTKFRK